MDRLTEDLVFDILSRLPIRPLMLCRCVCKPWRNLARDPRFIHSHLSRSSSPKQNPSLILTSTVSFNATVSFHTQIHFLEPETATGFACTDLKFSLPNLQEFRIVGSCDGLLWLAHRFHTSSIVCNPFTRDCARCPARVSQRRADEFEIPATVRGFGSCSNSNGYKLVEIAYSRTFSGSAIDLNPRVYVHTLGDSSWRFIGSAPYVIDGKFASNVVVSGAIHWISSGPTNLVVSFDFENEVFGVISHPQIDVGHDVCSLGVLDGCLSVTDSSKNERVDIWVMKDYGVKGSWVKCITVNFKNIGNHIGLINFMCLDINDELLMVYKNQLLLSYNTRKRSFRELSVSGLPSWFEAVTHVGSLVSPSGFFKKQSITLKSRFLNRQSKKKNR